ncbi:10736_t:CDS:2 [Funneliformis geosporum]|uniref:2546_t:CDS:1 n=1 Tax=Funneliformis geosporum TaxID=1117311 RepID=A0A9W4WXM8_9GLOM|nr:2546_t:CDS:2 [Funneliformis geosporum]CAI2172001.1 10736_t:CDS:2 [Funneliformis geosporum]
MLKLISTQECLNNLRNYKPKNDYLHVQYEKRAAVLLSLIIKEELEILFTLRSPNLSSHAGEISLPGGKVDDIDENLIATAFREAEEEVGLKSCDAEYLTHFEPFISRHLLLVTPVVALITNPSFRPIPNPSEVSECFTIPLRVFISKEYHVSYDIPWKNHVFKQHHFNWNNWTVIGLSAVICVEIAKIAFNIQNVGWEEMAKGQLSRQEHVEILLENIGSIEKRSKNSKL